MAPRQQCASVQRGTRFELLEARRVMSAQALGDFQVEYLTEHGVQIGAITDSFASGDLNQLLRDAHQQTGLTDVQNLYGFTGSGQTVAVIDTGIAYDHSALGGGLGADYQVVGGWDFSNENDADPYDDGFAGSHGTHVAGIIGSNDATNPGVAPGVDLVALRVFNDFGAGYFEWVEDALQWVHDNRNAFANPITAVNLSLGGSWNSDALPEWAILEEEFAQLEQDGIFISVAAGNSFGSYGEPGLGYPAASPHVVPVSSLDSDGTLSYYSQRHDRALAAPGAGIVSTIPDYKGNNNGIADDFASYSGTSMAAPYVAGASVLVRQAMEFMGHENITQQSIYDHLRDTADVIYDNATDAYYHSINLQAAIDALLPADDYGSTAATAYSLGTLTGGSTLAGLIGTTADTDYFTFTAGATGELSFSFATTHDLSLQGQVVGDAGAFQDNSLSLDVVAGQTYTIALGTSAGIGFYNADVYLDSADSGGDNGSGGTGTGNGGSGAGDTNSGDGGSKEGGSSKDGSGSDDSKKGGENNKDSADNAEGDAGNADSVNDDFAQARELDEQYGFFSSGQYHENWAGMGEKWIESEALGWVFITPDGKVHDWNGSYGNAAASPVIATLDASVHADPALLTDPPASTDDGNSGDTGSDDDSKDDGGSGKSKDGDNGKGKGGDSGAEDSGNDGGGAGDENSGDDGSDTGHGDDDGKNSSDGADGDSDGSDAANDDFAEARELDRRYGFFTSGDYYENWAGLGEKWIQSESLGWVFITADGKVHDWNGSYVHAGASPVIAELDVSFYADPSLLTDPPAAENSDGGQADGETGENDSSSVAQRAYDLDQQLELGTRGNYYTNWAGLGEKWLISANGQWYFITGDGALYRWNGSRVDIGASTLTDTLDPSYHADPSKLHDAPPPTVRKSAADAAPRVAEQDDLRDIARIVEFRFFDSLLASAHATSASLAGRPTTSDSVNSYQLTASMDSTRIQSMFWNTRPQPTHVTFASMDPNDALLRSGRRSADSSSRGELDREMEAVDAVFDTLEGLGLLARP